MIKTKLAKLDCECMLSRKVFMEGLMPNCTLKIRPSTMNCWICYDTGITPSPWWELEPRAYEVGLYFKE